MLIADVGRKHIHKRQEVCLRVCHFSPFHWTVEMPFLECLLVCVSALSNLAAFVLYSLNAAEGSHGREAR